MTIQTPSNNVVRTSVWRGTWSDLPVLPLPAKAAVVASDHNQALLAVKTHMHHRGELLLAADARFDSETIANLREQGFSIVRGFGTPEEAIEPPVSPQGAEAQTIWLLTSGSTGRPKRVRHTMDSLITVVSAQPHRRWLCAYAPGSYAWWQLITLSISHPGNDLVCVDLVDVDRWPEVALMNQVTAISGTPTFWRQAIWRDSPGVQALPLEQITLGGEPVDQVIIDQLRLLHPHARISWIYASSEAGAAIAVHDGLAGFPIEWLNRSTPGRPRLSIVDNELVLTSPFAAVGQGEGLRTGDRVEVSDGRVRIVGRIEADEINVGGAKASAAAVREAILSHDAVAWALVRARRVPIAGQVVVADVVLSGEVTEAELREYLALRLPDYAVPRKISVLPTIPLKESLKSDV